jgi:hypothetical protein
MHRFRFFLGALGLLFLSSPVLAVPITLSASNTVAANGAPWGTAGAATGNHFHNGMVNAGEMGVEEERGMVEFDLGAQGIVGSALLTFKNAPFTTCCMAGMTGGSYTIGVFSYSGNNAIALADYQAPGVLIGSFSTAGLAVGTPFSYDVTAAFNANAGASLGIRLQALSEPNQTSYSFGSFQIDTGAAAPVPEPSTMLLLGTGVAGLAVRHRRRRAAR